MKREFLENFKIGEEKLSKEAIDAIMAENGKDIEAAKKPFADYDTIKTQLGEAQATIAGMKKDGTTIEDAQKAAKEWETKYNEAIKNHKAEMENIAFNGILKDAIAAAKGKNDKAITALLDIGTLKASKNQSEDVKAAIEALKKDNGYMFDDEETPPPYARGTGKNNTGGSKYDPDVIGFAAAAGLKTE